jgi:hypothetical protein
MLAYNIYFDGLLTYLNLISSPVKHFFYLIVIV